MREFLVGRDPMRIGALWQEMYRSQYFEGGRVLQAAISALDIALHDIKGKALGVPVYDLLGGKQRDRDPDLRHRHRRRRPTSRSRSARQALKAARLGRDPPVPGRPEQPATSSSRATASPRPCRC